ESNPKLGLVFSDGELVDQALHPLGQRMWANCPFSPRAQRQFDRGVGPRTLLKYNVVTGAACAFRASLRPQLLPIPEGWVHDAWIAFVAASVAEAKTIAEPLILYRQHERQQIGLSPLTTGFQIAKARGMDAAYFEKRAECFAVLAERLSTLQNQIL